MTSHFVQSTASTMQSRNEARKNMLSNSTNPLMDAKSKPLHQGRTVLGGITNQSQPRVQPFRAAKQNCTTEGFFTAYQAGLELTKTQQTFQNKGFQIFDENHAPVVKQPQVIPDIASSSQLHPALTTLPCTRPPLSRICESNVSLSSSTSSCPTDSPMVLDDSLDMEKPSSQFDIDSNAGIYGLQEYVVEIFQHLRQAEQLHRPKLNYMRKQQDITCGMRSILIDWLVEVADEYKLHTESLHLAVNYIDRFLSQMAVLRGKLQLVGAAAMFLAAKYEEIYPPDVGEFVYITDDTYTKKQVLRMEHLILKVLNFDIAVPTSVEFVKRYLKAADADKRTEHLTYYLCELALIEFDCIQFVPSKIAAAATCLASYTVSGKLMDRTMSHYMEYTLEELLPVITRLHEIHCSAEKHQQQAIHEKYKDAKYDCVSKIAPCDALPTIDTEQRMDH